MKPLFSEEGMSRLKALSSAKTLYAFDFDGTLCGIVQDPIDAVASPKTTELFDRLSRCATTAVISGRSIADLKTRIRFHTHYLVGNHGLEGLDGHESWLERARNLSSKWKNRLKQDLSDPAIEIEDKKFSLAVHYRQAKAPNEAKLAILESVSRLEPPPRIIMGKSVVNLLPAGAPHKGVALAELIFRTGVQAAFYVGDDDTDEDVFGLPDQRIVTARVGFNAESSAQFYIEGQHRIADLLNILLGFLEHGRDDRPSAIA